MEGAHLGYSPGRFDRSVRGPEARWVPCGAALAAGSARPDPSACRSPATAAAPHVLATGSYMYPYYKESLERGEIAPNEALHLLEEVRVKMTGS